VKPTAKLGAYALVLAAVFGLGFAVGDVTRGSPPRPAPAHQMDHMDNMEMP
jgi:energy-converting hydrogenase Eha subunit F